MTENKQLWEKVLSELELVVSKANFSTWFKDAYILKQEDGVVYLSVPNAFVKDWLYNKFHKTILKGLRDFGESVRALEYIITKDDFKKKMMEAQKPSLEQRIGELPLADHYINKDDNLNPRYTFDSFVIGPFNELAHAASQAVIKKLGITYNPLFIYGNTGHGKTHLIQAIGNYIKTNYLNKKVYYITSEKFVIDYTTSVQTGKANSFKEKYRKYDVLIMDDVQFLSNKEKSQEELFHLFNYLYDNNKQIVFSSDKHPNFMPQLEDRLKSRFAQGMLIDIPTPDQESRVAIIKNKTTQLNFSLQNDVVEFLASISDSNIREIEGSINVILCQTQLKNRELSLIEIKNLIKNNTKPKKNISVKDIVKIVAGFYNIEEMSVYEKTRKKEVVKPRQIAMYILREDYNISYPSIGQKLGGRDHTTVIHSCDKIKNDIKMDPSLLHDITQIRTMI